MINTCKYVATTSSPTGSDVSNATRTGVSSQAPALPALVGTETAGEPAGIAGLWKLTLGEPSVTVAFLDGPCDASHPCLAGAALEQLAFVGSGRAEGRAGEHGTHTVSIVFGQHGTPVRGIAPKVRGLVIPIFECHASGDVAPCSQAQLARAIRLAISRGADIINVSGGQFSSGGVAEPELVGAVRECDEAGRLIVAAAGNDGCPCLHVPGALPSVLAVGAMRADGKPTEFSNWGASYLSNGVLAPGVNILGALPGGELAYRTGTSYAAPIVTGVAALLASLQVVRGQKPDVRAVRAAILESALGCEHQEVSECDRLLAGRLNVSGAVFRIVGGSKEAMNHQAVVNTSEFPPTPTAAEPEPSTGDSVAPANHPGVVAAHTPPMTAPRHGAPPAIDAVMASDCACQRQTQLVYAIGDLQIDFGTLAQLDSLQQNADGYVDGQRPDVRIHGHLIRHLVGWRELSSSDKPTLHKPHLYDAKAVIWVLQQDDAPVYAIRPSGPYAEEAYLELIHFLMEQEGYRDERAVYQPNGGVPSIYYPALDTKNGTEPNRTKDARGRPARLVERVAIPGTLDGTVRLYNGTVVPVICPDMRGTRSWNMASLVAMHCSEAPDQLAEMRNLERLAQRFFEEARNLGRTPEQRALNFVSTQTFGSVETLRKKFGEEVEWEMDSISVKRSPTCRESSDCYDVEVAFFNPDNIMQSKIVIARAVDVSISTPVLLGDDREYRRR